MISFRPAAPEENFSAWAGFLCSARKKPPSVVLLFEPFLAGAAFDFTLAAGFAVLFALDFFLAIDFPPSFDYGARNLVRCNRADSTSFCCAGSQFFHISANFS